MGAKKLGKKGPQRRTAEALSKAKSFDHFCRIHRHEEEDQSDNFLTRMFDPVQIDPLPDGGIEVVCHYCDVKQKFADNGRPGLLFNRRT